MTHPSATPNAEWNPLDFVCPHACKYCPEWRKELSMKPVLRKDWDKIPYGTAIWVCSDTDLFHDAVPSSLISKVLKRAREQSHGYIFCTKNPKRYKEFIDEIPPWSYLATTIESDIDHRNCNAEPPLKRFEHVTELKQLIADKYKTGALFPRAYPEVTICVQPILEFTPRFLELLTELQPDQVSIGPEKKGYTTPEPPFQEILDFAIELKMALKQNLVNVLGRSVIGVYGEEIITWEEWVADRTPTVIGTTLSLSDRIKAWVKKRFY